jgi:hypothetical protein
MNPRHFLVMALLGGYLLLFSQIVFACPYLKVTISAITNRAKKTIPDISDQLW